jgi:hypothetical protein
MLPAMQLLQVLALPACKLIHATLWAEERRGMELAGTANQEASLSDKRCAPGCSSRSPVLWAQQPQPRVMMRTANLLDTVLDVCAAEPWAPCICLQPAPTNHSIAKITCSARHQHTAEAWSLIRKLLPTADTKFHAN